MKENKKKDKLKIATVICAVIVFVLGIILTAINTGDTYALTVNDYICGTTGSFVDSYYGSIFCCPNGTKHLSTADGETDICLGTYDEDVIPTLTCLNNPTTSDFDENGKIYCERPAQPAYERALVSFNTDGGSTIGSRSSGKGLTIQLPTASGKSGYKFAHWKDSSGNIYAGGSSYTVPGSVTLTAIWVKAGDACYYCSSGNNYTWQSSEPSATTCQGGWTHVNKTQSECTNGSGSDNDGGNNNNNNNSTISTYTVRFYNGSTLYDTKTCTTEAGSTSCNINVPSSVPTKSGYTFAGWSYDCNSTKKYFQNFYTTGNATYYACFSTGSNNNNTTTYTITYHGNGGKYNGSETWEDNVRGPVAYGQKYKTWSNDRFFVRDGYTFIGWNEKADGSSTADWNSWIDKDWTWTYRSNVTLYAQWVRSQYTVTYNANGGTGTMDASTADYKQPFMTRQNTFTKAGYKFSGWNEAADGSGKWWYISDKNSGTYESGNSWIWTYTDDITLYAQWLVDDEKQEFTVTYDANGGKGTMESSTATYGEPFKTRKNTFTRDGYEFIGWNQKADGTGVEWGITSSDDGTYESGKSWTWHYGSDITLYAQWRKLENANDNPDDNVSDKTDDEISTNNKTGDALIYFAWIVGIGALGYAAYHFIKRKNNI